MFVQPGADALHTLAGIRAQRPTLRVTVLSVRADLPVRLMAFDAGATDCLAKPFSFDELVARLRTQIRQST